jgi:choline transport protein
MIQGLLVLTNQQYTLEQWHGTLIVIAITVFCMIFNTVLAKRLPMVEGLVLCIHIMGFAGILVPLWILAPRNSPRQVFTEFLNFGGWDTKCLSFFVGLLAPVYTLIGADSAVHMSEEVRNASLVLPRAIMWAAGINGSMGFAMIVTFCFTMGRVEDIIYSPTGFPFIQVFYNV